MDSKVVKCYEQGGLCDSYEDIIMMGLHINVVKSIYFYHSLLLQVTTADLGLFLSLLLTVITSCYFLLFLLVQVCGSS